MRESVCPRTWRWSLKFTHSTSLCSCLTAFDLWVAISLPFFAPHAFTVRYTLGCFRLSLQIYQLAFHADTKLLSRINSVSCNGPGRKKSFIHIEHRAGAVSRECLVQEKIAVLTLLPSKWVPVLAPSYLLQRQPERVFTLHQSMAQKPIRYATFHFRDRRCAPSLRHRKSRRNHQIRHDFRGDPNTIRYCTNIPRRLQEKAKEKKKEKASLSSYSVNRIHLRPL